MTQKIIDGNGIVSLGTVDCEGDLKPQPGISLNPPLEERTYKNPCKGCVLFDKCSTHCKELINLQVIVARKVHDVCYSDDNGYAQYFDADQIDTILTEIVEEFIQPKTFESVTITTDQVSVERNDGKIYNLIITL